MVRPSLRYRPRLEALEPKLAPATVRWNVDDNGSWDVGSNWDSGAVPQSGDDVIIDRPAGNYTVTFRQGVSSPRSLMSEEAFAITGGLLSIATASTINSTLALSGGTLGGAGAVTVSGLLTWTGGNMTGAGRTIANGGMSIDGANSKNLDTRSIDHVGTVTWSGTGDISAGNGSVWTNPAGSTFDIRSSAGFFYNFAGAAPTFRNQGTLQKSATAGVTVFQATLENANLTQVQTGTLTLEGNSTTAGRFAAAGGTLEFGDGTHALEEGSELQGAGTVRVSGTQTAVTVGGTFDVTGSTEITGGTLTFAAPGTTRHGALSGGTLTGAALFTVTGDFTWSGGRMTGAAVTHFSTTSRLTISGNGAKALDVRTLENAGNAAWTGTGDINLSNGATVHNQTKALFDAQDDARFVRFSGNVGGFTNDGTFRKSAGTGVTRFDISVAFNNNFLVEVQIGTLALAHGTSTGSFTVALDATLNFTLDTHDLTKTSSVTGQGTVRFTGGITNLAGTYDVLNTVMILGTANYSRDFTVPNLIQSGGVIAGAASFTITALHAWSGGTLAGPGSETVAVGATLHIQGAGAVFLDGRSINLFGAGLWTEAGTISTSNSPVITVQDSATFDMTDDGFVAGDGFFVNYGIVIKSGGGGPTTFGAGTTFGNANYVEVAVGRLRLLGDFTNFADQTLTGGFFYLVGVLQFVGADVRTNAATLILSGPSSGVVNQNNGNGLANFGANTGYFGLEEGRDLTVAAFTNSGTLAVRDPSTFTATGLFRWTGGLLSQTGTLRAEGGMELDSDFLFLSEMNILLGGTSTWTAGDLIAGDGARITIAQTATWNIPINANAYYSGSGDDARIINDGGIVAKTTSAGAATLGEGIRFTNNGDLRVNAGTLALMGGLTNYDPKTGALVGGIYSVTGTLRIPRAAIVSNQARFGLVGPTARIVDENGLNALRTLSGNAAGASIGLGLGAQLVTNAATFTNAGQITLAGGSSFVSTAATFTNSGQIDLFDANTTLSVTGNVVTGGAGSALTVRAGTILSATEVRLTSGLFTPTAATVNAAVTIEGGTCTASGVITGAVTVRGGTLNTTAVTTIHGNVTVVDGTYSALGTINGTVTLQGGTTTSSATINGNVVQENGTFNASGIINGNVTLRDGRLNIGGNAVGTLRVNGNWTQTGGILQVQLRTDTDYDRLSIRDTANLGGTLEVRLLNNYDPPLDLPFAFLEAMAVLATFRDVSPPAGTYRVEYGEMGATLVREE